MKFAIRKANEKNCRSNNRNRRKNRRDILQFKNRQKIFESVEKSLP